MISLDSPDESASLGTGVLDGIRVLEVGGYVTAPYATMVLADLGAEVVKIEPPGTGDPFRGWGSGLYSPTFVALNRNKRSVELDLGTAAGQQAIRRLAERADVAVVNVRPSVRERMGVTSRQLREANERLVYCSITGFGEDGPYADRPGYDTIGQALSGLLGMLIDPEDGKPPGVSVADHVTGMTAVQAILAALFHRERTGRGQVVCTSLLEASLSFIGENAARYLSDAHVPNRSHRTAMAQVYALECRGGAPLVIHLSSPNKFWEQLTSVLGLEDLSAEEELRERPGRVKNYDRIRGRLQRRVATLERKDCLDLLHAKGIPAAPVYGLDEVMADPQVQHLEMVWTFPAGDGDDEVRVIRPGYRLEDGDPVAGLRPPRLGEHTKEFLANPAAGHLPSLTQG